MFSRPLLRRAFATQSTLIQTLQLLFIVSPKFPEGTVAGVYKRAVAENELVDAVRFDAQRFNWNMREFDVCAFTIALTDILEIYLFLCFWFN